MAITDKEFDDNYLNRTVGGNYTDGKFRHSYRYSEVDREYLTCTNETLYKGEKITLDTMRADLDRIHAIINSTPIEVIEEILLV